MPNSGHPQSDSDSNQDDSAVPKLSSVLDAFIASIETISKDITAESLSAKKDTSISAATEPAKVRSATATAGGKRRPKQTGFDRRPGRRPMKEYPLTEGELNELATLGMLASLCFSLASGCFGFCISLAKDLAFASDVPAKVIAFWSAVKTLSFCGAIVLFLIGAFAIWRGKSKLKRIKGETVFRED